MSSPGRPSSGDAEDAALGTDQYPVHQRDNFAAFSAQPPTTSMQPRGATVSQEPLDGDIRNLHEIHSSFSIPGARNVPQSSGRFTLGPSTPQLNTERQVQSPFQNGHSAQILRSNPQSPHGQASSQGLRPNHQDPYSYQAPLWGSGSHTQGPHDQTHSYRPISHGQTFQFDQAGNPLEGSVQPDHRLVSYGPGPNAQTLLYPSLDPLREYLSDPGLYGDHGNGRIPASNLSPLDYHATPGTVNYGGVYPQDPQRNSQQAPIYNYAPRVPTSQQRQQRHAPYPLPGLPRYPSDPRRPTNIMSDTQRPRYGSSYRRTTRTLPPSHPHYIPHEYPPASAQSILTNAAVEKWLSELEEPTRVGTGHGDFQAQGFQQDLSRQAMSVMMAEEGGSDEDAPFELDEEYDAAHVAPGENSGQNQTPEVVQDLLSSDKQSANLDSGVVDDSDPFLV